jgi:hypothetical protein
MVPVSKIEIYKELGTYERHFNQMQSVYRGLASTWLLATFAGIEYVLDKSTTTYGGIDVRLAISMIALAGGTGIFLLWIIDVMVYHKLLVAVTKESKKIECDPDLPKLRTTMEADVVSWLWCVRLSARRKISLFYGIPALFLWLVALVSLILDGLPVGKQYPADLAIVLWLVLLLAFIITILNANREKK